MRIGFAGLILLAFATAAFAVTCSTLGSESSCEFSGCYWCERCFNNELNNYGQNTCVQSAGECLYSPSTVCGSQCGLNSDCRTFLNLSNDICSYSGLCSSGSCNYATEFCPQNGTVSDGVCYFGTRSCDSTGCVIDSCTLDAGEVCDPASGCVSCGQEDCGTNGDYLENYECRQNDVFAERVMYQCNATACSFSRTDTFIEKCSNGCFEGVCNEPLCNFNGLIRDCNAMDGFGPDQPYCKDNDVYRIYRNYFCGYQACEYNISERLIQDCPQACSNGQCVAEQTVEVDIGGVENPPEQEEEQGGQVARGYAGDVYNGWLFGQKSLEVETEPGRSGKILFEVTEANTIHDLKMTTNGIEIMRDRPGKGTYSVNFDNAGSKIIISAESSGWIFFMPNFYHLVRTYVVYN